MAKAPKTTPVTGTGLDAAIAAIEKAHGKGAIRRMSDETIVAIPVISTGLLELDVILGVGGIPRGRIGEIYGPESSGKTTLALHLLAQAQRYGPVAIIDAEHALDPAYASHLGVNMDRLLLSQPDSGEQAMQIARLLVNSGEVVMIVVDSVAAMTPLAEIQGEIGDQTMGALARLMGQSLRIMTPGCSTTGTSLVFINQIREKIGVLFGSPETQPGGRALKFYASYRIDVRRTEAIRQDKDQTGAITKLKTVKNKVGPPFKQVEIPMYFGEGLSRSASAIKVAVPLGVVVTNGSFHYYLGEPLGNGANNVREYLDEHPDVLESIIMDTRKILWPDELLQAPARMAPTKIDPAGSIEVGSTEAGAAPDANTAAANGKKATNGKVTSTPTATAKTIKAVTDDPISVAMREAVKAGVVTVRGSHHYFRKRMLGQGQKAVRALLTDDPSILSNTTVDTELALSPPPADLDPVVVDTPTEAATGDPAATPPPPAVSTQPEPEESEPYGSDDDTDVDQSVQDGFKVRDWFEANPGVPMDAVELSEELGIDAVRVVLQCERLAAAGRISQPDPNETIFIFR